MKTKTVKNKGDNRTYFLCKQDDGGIWYIHEGGTVVNLTYDIHFEDDIVCFGLVSDVDVFTWPERITSEKELEIAVNF